MCPERASNFCYHATDVPERIDPQRFAVHADADRRLPVSFSQSLHLEGYVTQGGEDQPPGEFRGCVRPAAAARGNNDAVLGARGDVDVARIASRLADEPEFG